MKLTWRESLIDFETYLRLEKSLSSNSIIAYMNDVSRLENFFSESGRNVLPSQVTYPDLKEFLVWFNLMNKNTRTQSRTLSGIRAFFKYLLIEGEIEENPS
jgi:integrase/recombinase XerD